jgi:hypothetical protein
MNERVRPRLQSSVFEPSPVLITESAEEFERFHDALIDELKPRGPLERLLVGDIAEKAWEVHRLRRVKTSLINSAFRPGLENLLERLFELPIEYFQKRAELDRLADQWFGNERDKKEVLELLEKAKLDESAIEAAAMQIAAPDLEKLDRLMASQEARLSRALRLLADLRGGFIGQQLRARVDRVIDGKTLALENVSKKPPAAA